MSALCKAIDEYLALRRSLGFELRKAGVLLEDFASFMETQGAETITTDLAIRWATQPTNVQVTYWAIRLCAVRQFAKFRKAVDSKTEVPPDGLLPFRYHRKPPHIYSDSCRGRPVYVVRPTALVLACMTSVTGWLLIP